MELGISSPLTQTGTCKFVRSWVVDTATIYHIGITRTGLLVIIHAVGNIVIGGTLMVLNKSHPWSGLGLWTGLPMITSGVICIIMRRKRPVNKASALSMICLLAFLATLISLATTTFNLISLSSSDPLQKYPHYNKGNSLTPLMVLNGILLALSVPLITFTLWSLCLSVGYVWPCFRQHGSNIFTIMVEEEPLECALVTETDTEMAAFTTTPGNQGNTRGILEIQTDWIQNIPTQVPGPR